MNRLKLVIMISTLCFAMASGIAGAQPEKSDLKKETKPEPRVIKHIIMVTVDDLDDKKMAAVSTPNISGLAAQGVRTSAVGIIPADFPVFAASLLTGTDPEVHGLLGSGDRMRTASLPDIAIKYGRSAAYVARTGDIPKGIFNQKGEPKVKVYEVAAGENRQVMAEAIKVFAQEKPYFMGIKLSLNENKFQGTSMTKTVKALNNVDGEIGKLLGALSSDGVFNDCLLVVVGSYSNSQSILSKNEKELKVPVIMTGPGLKISVSLPPARITDIAPTAALLAGIQMPPESQGFVLWNALKPGSGFQEQNLLSKRVKDLSDENFRSTVENYRLREEKGLVKVEREQIKSEKLMIQKTIEEKNRHIKSLNLKIALLKMAGLIVIATFGLGYVAEYFYLKKKFLMF